MIAGDVAEHALVIGGGIGGMCAARALSAHYRKVSLIERDHLPNTRGHRPGVPQSHHGHGLLLRGLNELDALFPGFAERLIQGGARRMDLGSHFGHFTEWGWSPRAETGVCPISANRLSIEHSLRELMLAQVPNLVVRDGVRVQKLLVERGNGLRVTGVEIIGPSGSEIIEADLVVDASGKNGKLPQWLAALDLPEPPTQVVDAHSAYASRFYRAPDPWPADWWWTGLVIDGKAPDQLREAMLLPCGDNEVVVMLTGVNGDHPPIDEAGFNAFVRSLRTPYLAHVISKCEPISPIHGSKPLWNRWRHFERWQSELPGYLCLGDTLVTFNPYHGQGMTVAAVAAGTLERVLRKVGPDPVHLPKTFYRENAKFVKDAWNLATMIDFGWPSTQGKRPLQWYLLAPVMQQVCRSIHEDALLKRYLGKLFHLVDPPSVALRPKVLWRLAWTIVRRALLGPVVPHDHDPFLALGQGEDQPSTESYALHQPAEAAE